MFLDREVEDFIEKKRNEIYLNPNSILKEYDMYLQSVGIIRGADEEWFKRRIKGHFELIDKILLLYNKAVLENERIALLEDLYAIGYDSDKLVLLILENYTCEKMKIRLWDCSNLLYCIKNYKYMEQYIEIVKNDSFGSDRQMLILLLGKSKDERVIPVLLEIINDESVYGHVLDALSNFKNPCITDIMMNYKDCNVKWVKNIAKRYLRNIS